MQVNKMLALVLVFCALLFARPAQAAGPGTESMAVVPAGGKAHSVQLRSQTVDVNISQVDGQVWADTQVWLRLSNPLTDTVAVVLALPGPVDAAIAKVISATLPADIKLSVEDEPQDFQPAEGGGLLVPIEIRGQGSISVRMSYRQVLPESSGLAFLAYPLTASRQWAGTPESMRMTVKFSGALPAEQIIGQAPLADQFDGQSLTWDVAGQKAGEDVWLAFMAPDWWAGFSKARSAAAAPGAGAAQQVALSQLYQHLASLPRLPFRPDLDFYVRYYPAAVGALQAAIDAAKAAGQPAEEGRIHGLLATLYGQQADRLGDSAGVLYLQLAANEAQMALTSGIDDPALRQLAGDAYRQLATSAAANGDATTAADYLNRLAAIEPSVQIGAGTEQQQATQLQVAAQQIAHGDRESARRTIAEMYGQDAAEVPGAARPLAEQAVLVVTTQPGQRLIRLTLGDFREPVAVAAMLDGAAEAIRGVRGVQVSSATDWLAVTLPYADLAGLTSLEHSIAGALPDDPELALLAAMLKTDQTSLLVDEGAYQRGSHYAERADLQAVQDTWEGLAAHIDSAAQAKQPAAQDQGSAAQLARLQEILWSGDAAAWRALTEASRAEYSVEMPQAGLSRQWVVRSGAARSMAADSVVWRYERILAIGAGGGLALALIAFIVWRWA
jgi:hypothetical protein